MLSDFDDFLKLLAGGFLLIVGITLFVISFEGKGKRFKRWFGNDTTLKISAGGLILLSVVLIYRTLFT